MLHLVNDLLIISIYYTLDLSSRLDSLEWDIMCLSIRSVRVWTKRGRHMMVEISLVDFCLALLLSQSISSLHASFPSWQDGTTALSMPLVATDSLAL